MKWKSSKLTRHYIHWCIQWSGKFRRRWRWWWWARESWWSPRWMWTARSSQCWPRWRTGCAWLSKTSRWSRTRWRSRPGRTYQTSKCRRRWNRSSWRCWRHCWLSSWGTTVADGWPFRSGIHCLEYRTSVARYRCTIERRRWRGTQRCWTDPWCSHCPSLQLRYSSGCIYINFCWRCRSESRPWRLRRNRRTAKYRCSNKSTTFHLLRSTRNSWDNDLACGDAMAYVTFGDLKFESLSLRRGGSWGVGRVFMRMQAMMANAIGTSNCTSVTTRFLQVWIIRFMNIAKNCCNSRTIPVSFVNSTPNTSITTLWCQS